MYFEDFEVGQQEVFGSYEVTKSEIIEFATKYDPQFFHLDEEAAKDSLFGQLCASGWHTSAMFMRMLVDSLPKENGALGSPGLSSLKWPQPVFPGYILSVKSCVTKCRLTKSKPGVGIICTDYDVVNQHGDIVMILESNAFYRCKDAKYTSE